VKRAVGCAQRGIRPPTQCNHDGFCEIREEGARFERRLRSWRASRDLGLGAADRRIDADRWHHGWPLYLDKNLAADYGVLPPTGDGFPKVALDPTQRAGIVTHGALLAANAKPNQTSPVLRGKFVREQFFVSNCRRLQPTSRS
jgi:hypothetical protein